MKKILLSLFALFAVMGASAQETDVTTLPWTMVEQGCATDFNNPDAALVFGTDASVGSISYVDVSDYGQITLYGEPNQRARLFINIEEFGNIKGTVYVDLDAEGKAVYDFNNLLSVQPTLQYIHLNGVKASSWNTKLNLSKITVSGDPIQFPELWTCPEGEIDFTTLPVVGRLIDNNIGAALGEGAVVYGSQSDGSNYTDVTAYGTVKFYGTPGLALRIFVNREGTSGVTAGSTEQNLTLDADGVAVLNVQDVMTATGKDYCYLSAVKTGWGAAGKINGITVTEKPAAAPVVTITEVDGTYEVTSTSETEALYYLCKPMSWLDEGETPESYLNNQIEGMGSMVDSEADWELYDHMGLVPAPKTFTVADYEAMYAGQEMFIVAANVGWDGEKLAVISNVALQKFTVPSPIPTPEFASVTLNAAGYATYSNEMDVMVATEGVEAYKAKVNGDKIELTKIEGIIPYCTGIILYGTPGTEVKFEYADFMNYEEADMSGNDLMATLDEFGDVVPVETNSWALGNDNKFLSFTGTDYIANRAYLVYEKPADVKMEIVFATTGIKNVNAAAREGKMLQNNRIVILKNGKKFNVAGQVIK